MKVKIVVHPQFRFLKQTFREIVEHFDSLSHVIRSDRNVIKTVTLSGVTYVIKKYGRIYLPNVIRYTYLSPSKAERAFIHGLHLIDKGFHTPHPVAYIERTRNFLLYDSYFIYEYEDFLPINQLPGGLSDAALDALAEHTYQLHRQGIFHLDYSKGNILVRDLNPISFSLIDNNRMRFGPVSAGDRLKNFQRLELSNSQYIRMAKAYAALSETDEVAIIEYLFHYIRKRKEAKAWKKWIKRFGKTLAFKKI